MFSYSKYRRNRRNRAITAIYQAVILTPRWYFRDVEVVHFHIGCHEEVDRARYSWRSEKIQAPTWKNKTPRRAHRSVSNDSSPLLSTLFTIPQRGNGDGGVARRTRISRLRASGRATFPRDCSYLVRGVSREWTDLYSRDAFTIHLRRIGYSSEMMQTPVFMAVLDFARSLSNVTLP